MGIEAKTSLALLFPLLLTGGCASTFSFDKEEETEKAPTMLHHSLDSSEIADVGISYVKSTTTIATNAPGYQYVLFPEQVPKVEKVSVVPVPDSHEDKIATASPLPLPVIEKIAKENTEESPEQAAWRKFCTSEEMTEAEYTLVNSGPLPKQWQDKCLPEK